MIGRPFQHLLGVIRELFSWCILWLLWLWPQIADFKY